MNPRDERKWRLTVACAIAQVSKADVAGHLGVTGGAITHWQTGGDRSLPGALTAERISAAISELGGVHCPPEALQAGSAYRPEWVERPPR